mmetsp:Transcript_1908/g.4509  ORF Transcript_1908/g.4509 Transcript_1908/m.4509 type:complete len:426 (+) Transcript_1908:84-1361(+)
MGSNHNGRWGLRLRKPYFIQSLAVLGVGQDEVQSRGVHRLQTTHGDHVGGIHRILRQPFVVPIPVVPRGHAGVGVWGALGGNLVLHLVAAGAAGHNLNEAAGVLVDALGLIFLPKWSVSPIPVGMSGEVEVHPVFLKELGHPALAHSLQGSVPTSDDPGPLLAVGVGCLQIRLEPGEVFAISTEVSRFQPGEVPVTCGRLLSARKVSLRVDGDEVDQAHVEAIPHVGSALADLRRHLPAVVVRSEVHERPPEEGVHDAGGAVALRLVVACCDHVRHARGQILEPIHVAVVGALVSEPDGRVGVGVVHIPDVPEVPNPVDGLLILPLLQCCAALSGRPVPLQAVQGDHHWPLRATLPAHVPEDGEGEGALRLRGGEAQHLRPLIVLGAANTVEVLGVGLQVRHLRMGVKACVAHVVVGRSFGGLVE